MRGDRQVAGTGRRVDVGRLAARRARERRKSYRPSRDLLVEPAALRPGLQAVEVEIGAKTQRINRAAEGAFEFAHTGKVDNVQALGRHVGEAVALGGYDLRRSTQLRLHGGSKELLVQPPAERRRKLAARHRLAVSQHG